MLIFMLPLPQNTHAFLGQLFQFKSSTLASTKHNRGFQDVCKQCCCLWLPVTSGYCCTWITCSYVPYQETCSCLSARNSSIGLLETQGIPNRTIFLHTCCFQHQNSVTRPQSTVCGTKLAGKTLVPTAVFCNCQNTLAACSSSKSAVLNR